MSSLTDSAIAANYKHGHIIVKMESGVQISFPVASNKRLARGTPKQLTNIEISAYGLLWSDLDEDLSFRGLVEGDYGQYTASRTSRCNRRAKARC